MQWLGMSPMARGKRAFFQQVRRNRRPAPTMKTGPTLRIVSCLGEGGQTEQFELRTVHSCGACELSYIIKAATRRRQTPKKSRVNERSWLGRGSESQASNQRAGQNGAK
jgi:hypothetical protein